MVAHAFRELTQSVGQRQRGASEPLGRIALGTEGVAGRGLGPLGPGTLRTGTRVRAPQTVGGREQPRRACEVAEPDQQFRRAVQDRRGDRLGALVGHRLAQRVGEHPQAELRAGLDGGQARVEGVQCRRELGRRGPRAAAARVRSQNTRAWATSSS